MYMLPSLLDRRCIGLVSSLVVHGVRATPPYNNQLITRMRWCQTAIATFHVCIRRVTDNQPPVVELNFTMDWASSGKSFNHNCNVRAIRYKRILFFMDCRDAYRFVRCGFVYVNVCYGAAFMYAAAQLCGRAYVVPRTRAAALS